MVKTNFCQTQIIVETAENSIHNYLTFSSDSRDMCHNEDKS